MRRTILPLLFLACFSYSNAEAYTYLIRYEAEPEFSRIVISWDELRGVLGVDHMRDNLDTYEAMGVYDTQIRCDENDLAYEHPYSMLKLVGHLPSDFFE